MKGSLRFSINLKNVLSISYKLNVFKELGIEVSKIDNKVEKNQEAMVIFWKPGVANVSRKKEGSTVICC